jgi:hypothetical protein
MTDSVNKNQSDGTKMKRKGDVIVVLLKLGNHVNSKIVSKLGTKYCRPLYSLAVCRQLSVTDSIAQNCLQITTNILDFSKYATVRLLTWVQQSLKCTYNITLRRVRIFGPGFILEGLTL